MSITGSIYTGASSLLSFGDSMAVIGNNIANVNTPGFKASRPEFANLLSTVDQEIEVGHGARLAGITRPFTQGGLDRTNNVTDLAVQGAGLFIVKDRSGSAFYTRAGQFVQNAKGALVNASGHTLQGFKIGSTGTVAGNVEDIVLDNSLKLPAQATTTISLSANLDAAATTPASTLPSNALGSVDTPSNWFNSGNFSTTVTVFDSLGESHDLTFIFRKDSSPNQWKYRVLANTGELSGGTAGNLSQVGLEGTLGFTSSGQMDTSTSSIPSIGAIAWGNGSSAQSITSANVKMSATQFATPSSVNALSQDGQAERALRGIEIDEQGIISGRFSNGGVQSLFQVALANFRSVESLETVGDSLFAESSDSGKATVGNPGAGGLGAVISGGLELSTVEMTREFVGLITSQRAFQVNSRLITIADRMYEQAVNLKR